MKIAIPWYDTFNNWASVYSSISCVAFLITYSVLAPWWKTVTGRLIMMLVASLAGLAMITLVLFAYKNVEVVRIVRACLIIAVGTALWFQVVAVVRIQINNRRKDKP